MKIKLFLCLLLSLQFIKAQNITANFTTLTSCVNNPICFMDLSTSNNGQITDWDWFFADGTSDSQLQNPCHIYAQPAVYNVILTVKNINGDTDTIMLPVNVVVCTGIESITKNENQVNIYPNPSNGTMFLEYDLPVYNTTLEIMDVSGKSITSYILTNSSGRQPIDQQDLENGIYFYQIISNGIIIKTNKLIINK